MYVYICFQLHPTIVVEFQWWTRRLPKTNAVPDGICQKLNAVSSGVCVKHKRRLKRRSYCMLIRFILTNTFESCSTNQLMQGVDLTKISRETRSFQKVFILFRITLIESVLIKVLIKQIHQRVSISRLLRVKIKLTRKIRILATHRYRSLVQQGLFFLKVKITQLS